jgi:hypothetical protein
MNRGGFFVVFTDASRGPYSTTINPEERQSVN